MAAETEVQPPEGNAPEGDQPNTPVFTDAEVTTSSHFADYKADPAKSRESNFAAAMEFARGKMAAEHQPSGEKPNDPKHVPYARFKEMNDRAKAAEDRSVKLEAKFDALIEQMSGQQQPAPPPEPELPKFDFAANQEAMVAAVDDSDSAAVGKLHMEALEGLRQQLTADFNSKLEEVVQQGATQSGNAVAIANLYQRHPQLNPQHPQYDQQTASLFNAAAAGFNDANTPPGLAIQKAEEHLTKLKVIGAAPPAPGMPGAAPTNPLEQMLNTPTQRSAQPTLGGTNGKPSQNKEFNFKAIEAMDPDDFDMAWKQGTFNDLRGDNHQPTL